MRKKINHLTKRVKLRTWVSLGLLLILLPIIIVTLFKPKTSEAIWFNDSWAYRQKLTFGNTGSPDSNKKVKFDIDTAALTTDKLQADCDDIRFTDVNGASLRFYLDTAGGACDTSSSDYYVLLQSIPAGTNELYMYYGNPSAQSAVAAAQFDEATFSPNTGPSAGSEEKGVGPVAMWHFDEGADNTCTGGTNDACDSSSGKNNGAISNGTAWKSEDICFIGKCLYFDGSNDIVTVTNAPQLDFDGNLAAGFTISAWIRPNGAGEGSGGQIYYKSATNFLRVDTLANNKLDIQASLDLGTTDATLNVTGVVVNNQWNNVALSYSDDADDEITIWVNGVNVGTSTDGSGAPAADSASLVIGGNTTDNFQGFIDEFKIYNFERSNAQMATSTSSRGGDEAASAIFSSGSQSYLTEGLVGYWKLDEASGNASDSSGNGSTLTNVSTTAYTAAKYGSGIEPDGTADYLHAADNAALSVTGSLTLSAWIEPDDITGTENIIAKWDGTNESYRLTKEAANIRMYIDSDSNYQATTGDPLAANTKVHVAGVYDAPNQTVKIYINGVEAASSTTGTIPTSIGDDAGQFQLAAEDHNNTPKNYFDGHIDEARVYSRAFSNTEVLSLANWAPGPNGYWRLDQNTGTSVTDDSANGVSGTIQQNTDPFRNGVFGSAARFNGNSHILLPTESYDSYTTGTICVWVKPYDTGDATQDFLSFGENDGGSNAQLLMLGYSNTDNAFYFLVKDGGSFLIVGGPGVTSTPNQWHHYCVTMDPVNFTTFYLNGVQTNGAYSLGGTTDAWIDNVSENTTLFTMGCGDTNNDTPTCSLPDEYFEGELDDVRIYNYVRTPQQIIEDMNGGHPTGGSPVGSQIGSWKFDEGQGQTLHNSISAISLTANRGTTSGSQASDGTWLGTSSCKFNRCIDFDGSDDVATVTNTAAIDFDENLRTGFTMSAWIYADGAGEGTGGRVFYKGTNTWLRVDTLSGGLLDIEGSTDLATTDATLNVAAKVPTSTWTHVALSYSDDADDEITIWVNGVAVGSSTNGVGSLATGDTNDLSIGGDTSNNFDGRIDEVQVYNSELLATQMQVVYRANAAVNFASGKSEESANLGSLGSEATLYWNLDENTGTSANDISGGENTGTLTNTPTWIPDKYGSGVNFAGSNQHITRADDADLDVAASTSFTIETWFKHASATATETLVSKIEASGTDGGYKLKMESDGDITCETDDDDADTTIDDTATTTAATYDDGVWHHVACVYDTSATDLLIYIDGILVASDTTTTTNSLANDDAFFYGIEAATGTEDWIGQLDNLVIYKYARTQAQVAYDYSRGEPIAWWKFDENSGATSNDSSINSFTGTLTGSPTWTTGKYNYGISLNGSSQYSTVSDNQALRFDSSTQDFSVFAWIKLAATGSEMDIVSKEDADNDGWRLELTSGGIVRCSANSTDVDSATAITDTTTWHLVGCVMNRSGNGQVYIDGKANGTATAVSGITMATTAGLRIGALSYTTIANYFNGVIDDVQVFNFALGLSQIQKLYNEGSAIRFGPRN